VVLEIRAASRCHDQDNRPYVTQAVKSDSNDGSWEQEEAVSVLHTTSNLPEKILGVDDANWEMSGRYGKQLLNNVQWRRDCVAKVGLGFTLPTKEERPLVDKSGQLLKDERQEVVAA